MEHNKIHICTSCCTWFESSWILCTSMCY